MSLMERIRELLSGDPQTVDQIRVGVTELEAELKSAEAAAVAESDRHNAQAMELLSRSDDTGLQKSRDRVAEAEANVADVRAALAAARAQLTAAELARAQGDLDMRWEIAHRLLRRRVEKATELQRLLDQVADRFGELLELTEQAYQSLPAKPDSRPLMMTQAGLGTAIEMYLFGATDGRLSSPGGASSAHVARTRPDLVNVSDDLCVMLMAKRIQAEKVTS
ncbi:hypothetical protein [Cupriavidus sp. CuC1]|uniref:hypothetical protein n=1 Tax=Cupriavidus sp. CuC1 TaxID=3373131 RepID=UPI0037D4C72A